MSLKRLVTSRTPWRELGGLSFALLLSLGACTTTSTLVQPDTPQPRASPKISSSSKALGAPHSSTPYTPQTTFNKLIKKYPQIRIASSVPPVSVEAITDVKYICREQRCLSLDMYRPRAKSQTALPAIVLVHGGGWRSGNRSLMSALAIALAKKGWVTTTVSYRLAGEAKYPAAVHDLKAAVRWLREHAAEYGVDPGFIAIGGGSAGGQMASLVGTTNSLKQFDPQTELSEISSDVQAIINIDGLSDFTLAETLKYENDPRKTPSSAGEWFGGRYEDVPERWRQASPVNYINPRTPPMLFIRSGERRFSLGYREVTEKYRQLNLYTHVINFPASPHSFWLFDPWLSPTANAIDSFLSTVTQSSQGEQGG